MTLPSVITAARSRQFSSSRTLPGQSWCISTRSALSVRLEFAALLAADLVHQEAGEVGDVLHALAQGGQVDRHHVEPVVEVLAEAPGLDLGFEVAVGGGDDAHVDLDGAGAADALQLAFLQHAQQLGLEGGGDLADLVEEQGAAVGLLEAALALRRPRR